MKDENMFYVEYNYDKIKTDLRLYSENVGKSDEVLFGNKIDDLSEDELLLFSERAHIYLDAKRNVEKIGLQKVKDYIIKTMTKRGFGGIVNYDKVDIVTLWESYQNCKMKKKILK